MYQCWVVICFLLKTTTSGYLKKKEPVSSGHFKNQNQRIGCIWVFEKRQNQTTSRFWVFEKPSTIEELCNSGYFKTLPKPLVFMKE